MKINLKLLNLCLIALLSFGMTDVVGYRVSVAQTSPESMSGQGRVVNGLRQGQWEFSHPGGQSWVKCHYQNGKLHGAWEVRYSDGRVEETGSYRDGKHEGQWVWYYPNDKVYLRGHFVADQKDGLWESFDEQGNLWWKGSFSQDQKHGLWEAWSKGILVETANFSQGIQEGEWRSFHSNGKVHFQGQFHQGNKVGIWKEYDTAGRELASINFGVSNQPVQPPPTDELHLAKQELRKRLNPTFQIDSAGPFLIASEAPKFMTDRVKTYTVLWLHQQMLRDFTRKAPPTGSKTIYLFQTPESYNNYTLQWYGYVPLNAAGFATDDALMVNLATGTGTLAHELVHAYLHADLPSIPPWIDEGLASLFEQSVGVNDQIRGLPNWRLPLLKEAIREKQLVPLTELTRLDRNAFSGDGIELHYAEARYLCYYLQELGLLRQFYRTYRDNYQTDPLGIDTLLQVLNKDNLKDLEAGWVGFINTLVNRSAILILNPTFRTSNTLQNVG
ncbi:toxin-antitoxin system YwqK family antitoxin [Microcystis aeruginosa]|uniref:Peptidase MA-like domain-containing protein n=1 Tax=Microcystis aeruginosa FD4 TaxID=2686288 RepID=A0A857D1J7_MICAE|nr:toxin-antitoxin system YwqK family antitoxin [Microcystis aeruginosa]QGZ89541.1 hypothetical protein GQR42_08165 [Microcystis aeruginosa FD4]